MIELAPVPQAVTGDPNKRIRDHMKEVPQVKMIDKFSFTIGVVIICLMEFIALRKPDRFPMLYYATLSFLVVFRFFDYKRDKFQYFMLDFCYFVNASVIIQTAFYPDDLAWFKTNFVCAFGPLCVAVPVWKNSLVFHRQAIAKPP